MTFECDEGASWQPPDRLVNLFNRANAILWDFDGVIADTEPFQERAFRRVLNSIGVDLPEGAWTLLMGRSEREIWAHLTREYRLLQSIELLSKNRTEVYLELARKYLSPAYYVQPLINLSKARGTPNIIVSSGNYTTISLLLDYWTLSTGFDAIYCNGSPDGAWLSDKIDRIDHVISNWRLPVVIIEDSPVFLKHAGMRGVRTIAVKHGVNDLSRTSYDFLLELSNVS